MSAPTRMLWSWAFYDWGNSAFSAIIETFVLAAFFTEVVATNPESGTAAWGWAVGVAGIIIALLGPFLGSLADRGGHEKTWIGFFTILSVLCTGLLWVATEKPHEELFVLLLLMLGVVGSECAYIFYNAMLPSLSSTEKIGRWSGWGWGLGYIGGMLSLILSMVVIKYPELFFLTSINSEHIRATFVLAAAWYLIFSLPLFFVVRLPEKKTLPLAQCVREGWKQVKCTLSHVRQYRGLFRFFIARMIFIDGLITLFTFGGIYVASAFHLQAQEILLFGIFLNLAAGVGAGLFALLDDKIGGKKMILISLVALATVSVIALFVSTIQHFLICSFFIGIFVGPVQASSRSYLARVAPPELMNEMFGFFALTGKATSFIGPIVVGTLTYLTSSLLMGMSVIPLFFIIGGLLMWGVPADSCDCDDKEECQHAEISE